jgi:hypothetical protein
MKKVFTLLMLFIFLKATPLLSQNGLNFDGTNDYVQTTFAGISGTGPRTVECWMRTTADAISNQQVLVDWGSNTTGGRFTLNILWSNSIRIEVNGNGISGTTPVNDGQWHHLAVTYDPMAPNQAYLYIDGNLETSGNFTVPVNTGSTVNMRIGKRIDDAKLFTGDIDEVRVWNVARTQTQIQNDMNHEICNLSNSLVAYYPLNQGNAGAANTLTSATNYGSTSQSATLYNFALSGATSNWVSGKTLAAGFSTGTFTTSSCGPYTWAQNGQTYNSSGTYYATTTNMLGCDSIVKLVLTVSNVNNPTSVASSCDSYFWNVTGQTYTSTGSYVANLVNGVGCPYTHTLNLTIKNSSSSTQTQSSCGTYFWPVNNQSYTSSGQYQHTIQNAAGCDSVITLDLTINTIVADATAIDQLTLSATNSTGTYQWIDCSNSNWINGATSQTFTATQNGSYAVIVEENGCADTSACLAISSVGLNEMNVKNFTIYPNPFNESLTISTTPGLLSKITLFTLEGKYLQSVDSTSGKTILLTDELSPGTYMLLIDNEIGQFRQKLVK